MVLIKIKAKEEVRRASSEFMLSLIVFDLQKLLQVMITKPAPTCSLDDAFWEFLHILGCLWCYFYRRMIHSLCNNECKYFSLLNLVFFGFIMNCAHNTERSGSFNKNHDENSPFAGLCSFKNRHIREAVVSNDVENNLSIRMPEWKIKSSQRN